MIGRICCRCVCYIQGFISARLQRHTSTCVYEALLLERSLFLSLPLQILLNLGRHKYGVHCLVFPRKLPMPPDAAFRIADSDVRKRVALNARSMCSFSVLGAQCSGTAVCLSSCVRWRVRSVVQHFMKQQSVKSTVPETM